MIISRRALVSRVHWLGTTHVLHGATPWGTSHPLILDPIGMVLAAIAVQITTILDLALRNAEDGKPLCLEMHRLTIRTSTAEYIGWSADGLLEVVQDGREALVLEGENNGAQRRGQNTRAL